MKRIVLALALLFTVPAAAQSPLPTVTFVVTPAELEIISTALGKEPYMSVRDLVNKLQAQVNQQVKEKADGGKK